MKAPLAWTLALALAAGTGIGGFYYGRAAARHGDTAVEAEPTTAPATDADAPVVAVQVVPIRSGTLLSKIVAYGPVTTQANDVSVISVPYESRVGHLIVAAGQQVEAGAVIGTVAASPDTLLQIRQAKAALAAAKTDLSQTQQRFSEHLATNTDLSLAQQNLETAQLKFDSFNSGGATETQQLKSSASGIISKIDVQDGQIVPAGGPLVEVAAGNQVVARLGVEPQDANLIHENDAFSLTQIRSGAGAITGKVNLVTRRLNADTRLIDVFVSLPKESGLILDEFVRGEFSASSAAGFIVPRAAVLSDDEGSAIFIVKDGKASRQKVEVARQNDEESLITGPALHADDAVIIVGNYELEDGMAVTVQAAGNQPAATEPAAQPEGKP